MLTDNDEVRFWMAVKSSRDGCWEWQLSTCGARPGNQYGVFTCNSRRIGAHRYSWLIHYGEITAGLFV
jgi:hypothetical protein